MAEKRVSVRLSARGGDSVKREFREVGQAGQKGFARVRAEMGRAEKAVDRVGRRMKQLAAVGAAVAAGALGALVTRSLDTIDAQAKLAQSLGTTVASIQTLERAGALAGVSMSGIEQATKDLTRRLSQAAAGGGPAVQALDRLGLSASALLALPLDERVAAINGAIAEFVPVAERAAVAGQLFGEEGSIAMSRIDTATLRQATRDVREFGVVVTEADAEQIEVTNDAISRLSLVAQGLGNRVAVSVAPALQAMADALAAASREGGALRGLVDGLAGNLDTLARVAGLVATLMLGRWVRGFIKAEAAVRGVAFAVAALGRLFRLTIVGFVIGVIERLIAHFSSLNTTLSEGSRAAFAALGQAVDFGVRGIVRLIDVTAQAILRVLELFGVLERPVKLQLQDAVSELRRVQDQLAAISQGRAGPGAMLNQAELRRRESELLAEVRRLEERRQQIAAAATGGPAPAAPPPLNVPPAPTLPPAGAGAGGGGGGGGAAPGRPLGDDPFFADRRAGLAATAQQVTGVADAITGPFKQALTGGELTVRSFADATVGALRNLSARIIENAFKPLETFIANFVQRIASSVSGGGDGGGGSTIGKILSTVVSAAASAFGGGGGGVSTFASTSQALGTQGLFNASGNIILPFAKGGVIDRPTVFPMRDGIGLAGEAGREAILPLKRMRGGSLGVEAGAAQPELRQNVVVVDSPQSVGRWLGTPEGERTLVITLERAGFQRG